MYLLIGKIKTRNISPYPNNDKLILALLGICFNKKNRKIWKLPLSIRDFKFRVHSVSNICYAMFWYKKWSLANELEIQVVTLINAIITHFFLYKFITFSTLTNVSKTFVSILLKNILSDKNIL